MKYSDPQPQTIKINGGAIIEGVLVAPNSNITMNGQATITGAIIAKSFSANNGSFEGDLSSDTITLPSYGEGKPLPDQLSFEVQEN